MSAVDTLLRVCNLSVCYGDNAPAVEGISFSVKAGQVFALIGESGCGKTTTAMAIPRLLDPMQGRVTGGQILFEGRDLLSLNAGQMRRVRGAQIALVFQEPADSLNPVLTVGSQVAEAIALHCELNRGQVWDRAVRMLESVGIPGRRAADYPHQFSGGMQQRAVIAMAASCRAKLIIADEPTTALDVIVQAQILDLLDRIRRRDGVGILLVTHDLAVVAERADAAAVMYAGKVVERAPIPKLFDQPAHPYTSALMRYVPDRRARTKRAETICPTLLPLVARQVCRYRPCCPIGADERICRDVEPQLKEVAPGHLVACWKAPGTPRRGSG